MREMHVRYPARHGAGASGGPDLEETSEESRDAGQGAKRRAAALLGQDVLTLQLRHYNCTTRVTEHIDRCPEHVQQSIDC